MTLEEEGEEEEGRYPGVANCCPFHELIEKATCDDFDKTGDPIVFSRTHTRKIMGLFPSVFCDDCNALMQSQNTL